MKRSPRQVGLVAGTLLALTMALTVATASVASADPPDLSSDQAINAYLVSIGVDPAEAVWQRGLKNYAGPSCPGAGWNCVRANAPIVQIAASGGTNLFYCTGLDCLVVQVAHNGGHNASACERRVEGPTETVMVCDITQANGPGTNAAGIAQHIQQSQGVTQRAREIARITQVNDTGSNIARIIQGIGQTQNAKGGASIAQTQEAHQAGTVGQLTTTGANTSNIDQRQDQSQRASGTTGLITQKQNTIVETDPTFDVENHCDQPEDAPDPEDPLDVSTLGQPKNQCADVQQDSDLVTGGDINSNLRQLVRENQAASNAPSVDQDQGSLSGFHGQEGEVDQNSSAPDQSDAIQDTLQAQTTTGVPQAGVSQFKDTGDPRCCATQTINMASSAEITQRTVQSASSDGAVQVARFVGECMSTGTCDVFQSATIEGSTDTNDCSNGPPGFCEEVFVCTEVSGEGGTQTVCEPPDIIVD